MSRELVPLAQVQDRWPWGTERYLRRCVSEKRIPHHKIGNRIFFAPADLDAHEEAARIEPFERSARSSTTRTPAQHLVLTGGGRAGVTPLRRTSRAGSSP
jgi:hypothetical protein